MHNFVFFKDMPGSGPKNYPCTLCKKRTKPDERRPVNKDTRKILRKCFMIDCADGVLCRKCRHKCGNLKPTSSRTEKSCVRPTLCNSHTESCGKKYCCEHEESTLCYFAFTKHSKYTCLLCIV